MNMSTKYVLGALLAVLIGAVFLYAIFGRGTEPSREMSAFINPVAGLVKNRNLSIGARVTLQEELNSFADAALRDGRIANYGIYYRELISGPVIALNQHEGFFPASLLKLPVALWYYKKAEEVPGLLEQEILFNGPRGVTVAEYLPSRTVEPGTRYTMRELIELMLAESDNDATTILVEYTGGRDAINEIYQDVGIEGVENYDIYVIDTQTYLAFFRVLFNAELLSEEASAEVLGMLTQSSFKGGLPARIPKDVPIAHKFGERELGGGTRQLHDCGIVYVPENPYLLCLMTQGSDYAAMADFIAETSKTIYDAASSAKVVR